MHQVCFFPLLVALLTLVAVPAAHGAEESSAPAPAVPQSLLPDNVLHFLFHVETNLKLEQLGNVRRSRLILFTCRLQQCCVPLAAANPARWDLPLTARSHVRRYPTWRAAP